ncbi:MAG TPA: adenylate/guanylate cyclase domain-containing protein [Acidimicrobiia bacterium]|nr:adenylate/guanylate cyclase domain-containing protein [Acidimicrobiia bacterium]
MTDPSAAVAGERAGGTAPIELGRFVPRIAVDWDEISPGRQWRELDGTLCFVDISGFTNLSERLAKRGRIGAEELTEILDRSFSAMLQTAYAYGGSLIKFGGDALLLLFTGSDHALRAASGVVAMQATLRTTSEETTASGKIRLRMSVGVHSGTIHLFCVGTSHRELMITGPAGTVTTRMEHTADAGEIVVSPATRDLLPKGAAPVAKGPGWRLKWRKPPIEPPHVAGRADLETADVSLWVPAALRTFLSAAQPEPEHRVATIGFVRFCGVDERIKREGPEAVALGLQQMIDVIQDAVDIEGVTFLATDINEDGGKVLVSAGAPAVQEDDDGRMLRAMRRIADADTRFDLHIGVNRGHVFAGEIGTAYRSTYTVMGDTVNVAARLCAAAWAGRILVSPDVLERSHTLYTTSRLDPLTVKGKSEPLDVYEVGEEIGFRAETTRTDLPFAGRTDELAIVTAAFTPDGGKGTRVVTISGETGVGKSRLVEEAVRTHPDTRTIELRAEPYGVASPYRPFRDPIRSILGITRDTQPVMADQLRTSVTALDPAILPMLPLLGDLAHVDIAETPETGAIEPRFRRSRLGDVVISLLTRVLEPGVVFVVEDAHWMDEASADLLDRLARSAIDHHWSMLVTRRPEGDGFDPARGRRIELQPLTITESEALVLAATSAAPLRPHEVDAIARRAGGNPLFIEESIRMVREAGGSESLPDSLSAVVDARIDALPPLARRILRYASVLGQSFRTEALQGVLEPEHIQLDAATRGELGGFLERDGRMRLRFKHGLARDVAYAGLAFRRRSELHLRIAEAAERQAGDHVEEVADLLATHYALAGSHESTWRYARMAGDSAKEAYANVEAAANYERALDAVKRLDNVTPADRASVWISLGDVREPIGLFGKALEAYRRASRLLDADPVARAAVQYKRATVRDRAGDYSMALREITIGGKILDGTHTRDAAKVRARLAVRRASVRQAQERPGDAITLAGIAMRQAEEAGEPRAEAGACMVLHWSHLVLGRTGGTQYGERALRLFEELGELEQVAGVTNNLGAEAYFAGAWDRAVEFYRQGQDAAQRAGDLLYAALIGSNIGELLVNQGHLDEAEPILRDAARIQRASDWVEGADAADHYLGRLHARRGEYAEATRLLRAVFDDYTERKRPAMAAETGLHLARTLVAAGELQSARELLSEVEPTALANGQDTLLALVQTELLAASGEPAEALAVARSRLQSVSEDELDFELSLLVTHAATIGDAARDPLPPALVAAARATLGRLGVLGFE